MKKQNLGKSSLQISPLCLGLSMGHNDFSEQGQQQFNQLINRALDLGLNFWIVQTPIGMDCTKLG